MSKLLKLSNGTIINPKYIAAMYYQKPDEFCPTAYYVLTIMVGDGDEGLEKIVIVYGKGHDAGNQLDADVKKLEERLDFE